MRGGINASYIDSEYRKRKIYEKRKRQECPKKECEKCMYRNICEDNEENGGV